jgi:hypothetical protein
MSIFLRFLPRIIFYFVFFASSLSLALGLRNVGGFRMYNGRVSCILNDQLVLFASIFVHLYLQCIHNTLELMLEGFVGSLEVRDDLV